MEFSPTNLNNWVFFLHLKQNKIFSKIMGTDFLTNKNFSTKFQKMMNEQKPEEPETWRGDLSSLVVQYGIPGFGWAKLAHRLSKMGPLIKVMSKQVLLELL